MNHLRFGFAAGCDGGYAPPKTGQIIPGYALGSDLGLQIYWAKSCTKGIAQEWKGNLYGGAKPPPQNPGGKAETQMANYFEKVTSICTIS